MSTSHRERPRIIFVINVDWFFLLHRVPVARAALEAGAEVIIVAGDTGRGDEIAAEGFRFVPLAVGRRSLNPARELRTLLSLIRIYRNLRPTLVHHVTIKPVLYGSVAARLVGGMAVVNALSGLGWLFGPSLRARLLRPFVRVLLRHALKAPNSRTVFENPDNRSDFVARGLIDGAHAVVIRGAGVDCRRFMPTSEPESLPVVLLAARMLWDKGVKQFVEAARLLNGSERCARFVLVGEPDMGNPGAVPKERLRAWVREGVVEWWGARRDMPTVLAGASIVVLPTTYPEGVPTVLVEAAASGRAVIAFDVPGCREIVRPGVNGELVPTGNVVKLSDAIRGLVRDRTRRQSYGAAGRRIAVAEFAVEHVAAATLTVYRELLGERWPGVRFNELGAGSIPSAQTI